MNEKSPFIKRLFDLQRNSERWHTCTSTGFLSENEVADAQTFFSISDTTRYEGGYPGARKVKLFFLFDPMEAYDDIVCLRSRIDQRFRKISHRDVLGAIMHLQVEPDSFGDFWIEDDYIYLYTDENMVDFFTTYLTRINQLNVHFEIIQERPIQKLNTKEIQSVAGSERLDALVATLAHISRSKASEKIRDGEVKVNGRVVVRCDEVCHNNNTISIHRVGRFMYLGYDRTTKSDRIVAKFIQYI